MLALTVLNKLIKLEFKALDALAIKLHLSTNLYGKEIAQFANKVNEYIFKNFVEYRYDEMHSYHIYGGMRDGDDFEFDLPMPYVTAQSLAADVIAAINESNESTSDVLTACLDDSLPSYAQYLTVPNPNRFVKSSFALSLLWVAKFYSSITNDSLNNSTDKFFAGQSTSKAMYGLSRLIGCFKQPSSIYDYIHLTY